MVFREILSLTWYLLLWGLVPLLVHFLKCKHHYIWADKSGWRSCSVLDTLLVTWWRSWAEEAVVGNAGWDDWRSPCAGCCAIWRLDSSTGWTTQPSWGWCLPRGPWILLCSFMSSLFPLPGAHGGRDRGTTQYIPSAFQVETNLWPLSSLTLCPLLMLSFSFPDVPFLFFPFSPGCLRFSWIFVGEISICASWLLEALCPIFCGEPSQP